MLYVAENKRKTIAGLLAAALTLAVGFGVGRVSDPSSPDLTPQLAAARHRLVRQHAATVAAGGQLANAQRTVIQLRTAIARQPTQIAVLKQDRGPVHARKRRR